MMTTRFEPGCTECSIWRTPTPPSATPKTGPPNRTSGGASPPKFTSLLAVVESAQRAHAQFDFVCETRGLDYVTEVRSESGGVHSPRR